MKKLLSILFFVLMAGQAVDAFHAMPAKVDMVHEADEKKESSKEDKKEDKEAISGTYSILLKSSKRAGFISMPAFAIPFPLLDHLTPPPDRVSCS